MKRNAIRDDAGGRIGLGRAGAALRGAQNFPARPVTLIVPWPAGGTTDVGMRALASATEKHLGQSIVIENRPGGSGTLGPGQMAVDRQARRLHGRADPDHDLPLPVHDTRRPSIRPRTSPTSSASAATPSASW